MIKKIILFVTLLLLFSFTTITYANGWYDAAFQWAINNNIIVGYGDGSYHPNDNITRSQVVQMLYNYDKQRSTDEQLTISAISKAYPSVVTVQGNETGAGVIIDSTHILTVYHLVNGSKQATINGIFTGTVIKHDGDLALLQFASSQTVVPITISNDVSLGETVIAIGNPLNMGLSVTKGIVSKTRQDTFVGGGVNQVLSEIQIDAPINPGNSGGALINENGELVGIVDAKMQQSEGIGYAIPISTVKQFLGR